MLGTIVRAGEVLRLFTREHPEWGVTEVAASLDIPKSNAHDILSSLVSTGLLQRTPSSRYALGWRLLSMSRTALGGTLLQQAAWPEMRGLHGRFGGRVGIAAWDGDDVVMLGMLVGASDSSPRPSAIGLVVPSHATAVGKILLADRCRDVGSLGFVSLEPLTGRTLTSADELMGEISAARRRGYASAVGELMNEVSAIAAPVRDRRGTVVAAVGVGIRTDRFLSRRDELRAAVVGCVARISSHMSYLARVGRRPTPGT